MAISGQVVFEGTVATIGVTLDKGIPILIGLELHLSNMNGPDADALVNHCLCLANKILAEMSSTGFERCPERLRG